eukprot:jgi/Mesvir1/27010/Mv20717-RA.1
MMASTGFESTARRRVDNLCSHLIPGVGTHEPLSITTNCTAAMGSAFQNIPLAPDDPILGVTVAFNNDPDPTKVNLGVGAYRTNDGKPLVLQAVRKAEQAILNDSSMNKEYLPIAGFAPFTDVTARLILGDTSAAIREKRVATVQALSGTGALRLAAEFIAQHYHTPHVLIPDPTWGNHNKIFPLGGCKISHYRYFDKATKGLDMKGLLADLEAAPNGAVLLLHACAHNPTGVDPTEEQWAAIADLCERKKFFAFFDSAYQGFASGSLDRDAFSVRLFVSRGLEVMVAQSYAKNMGLYGERVGALNVVCADADVAKRVESQLKMVIRPMYSNPPKHGAAIAARILTDKSLFAEWQVELKGMSERIIAMRQALVDALKKRGTPGNWDHVVKQIGMFTFTGLNKNQVQYMRDNYHIYMTADGRISVAGINSSNVDHLANAINAAVLNVK